MWLTRGEATDAYGRLPIEEVAARRDALAARVGELLGIETLFLDFPDTAVQADHDSAFRVARILADIRPDGVLTWGDAWVRGMRHPDHQATGRIVRDAITLARIRRRRRAESSAPGTRRRCSPTAAFTPLCRPSRSTPSPGSTGSSRSATFTTKNSSSRTVAGSRPDCRRSEPAGVSSGRRNSMHGKRSEASSSLCSRPVRPVSNLTRNGREQIPLAGTDPAPLLVRFTRRS